MGIKYKDAGVDISRQDEALKQIKSLVAETRTGQAAAQIGGFGGTVSLDLKRYSQPLLVSSIDGVGTKIFIARDVGRVESVGYDLVCHCVNDILTQGAIPLFFLDYISSSELEPAIVVQIITGMVQACKENGCALVGGELAEMPGLYQKGDFDLVGAITGIVNAPDRIDGTLISDGDTIIGLPSTGLHTNGYSLARKIFFEQEKLQLNDIFPLGGGTVADVLLAVHRSYYPCIKELLPLRIIKGIAHITGGGLLDNVPRILQGKYNAQIRKDAWMVPPVFQFLLERGNIEMADAYQAFNMGIGLVLVVSPEQEDMVMRHLQAKKDAPVVIGKIIKGEGEVHIL